MSGYGDQFKDDEQRRFVERWAPRDEGPVPEWDEETRRWWLARARSAETKVAAYEQTLRGFRKLLEEIR